MSKTNGRCLGRLPSRRDPRTLKLADYIQAKLPPPPDASDWSKPVAEWKSLGNDAYGDCVYAGVGHHIMTWTANKTGEPHAVTAEEIIAAYLSDTGGDNGANILDTCKIWRSRGICGHRIWAFAAVEPQNHAMIRSAIDLFGGIKTGVNLPRAWQDAEFWDTGKGRSYDPGTWGGHDVPIIAYNANFLTCVTWGQLQRLTWAAFDEYFDEAYAMISPEWIAPGGETPNGFDLPALHADLQAVTS